MKKLLIVSIFAATLFFGVASVASASGHYCGGGDRCHVVHYGETLFSIGRHYDVHPYHIAEVNNLYDPNHIYAGQVLYIPHGSRYPWQAGCHQYDCSYPKHYQKSNYHYDKCSSYDCGQNKDYGHGYDKCGSHDCGYNQGSKYGYDYTGYYYSDHKKTYSYTCGYYSNCW